MRRRQREWVEIVSHPHTSYMIGRLLGANEMAVALLGREENEVAKHVAKVLESVSTYFMEDVPVGDE